jgi:hypothetical protein
MPRLAALLLLLPLAVAACGGDAAKTAGGGDTTATPTVTVTTTRPETPATTATTARAAARTSLVVYYLRGGRVAPVRVAVDSTPAVAHAALGVLADAPPEGYSSELEGADVRNVRIDGGVAKPDWGDQTPSHAAAAQVVYTLTEFQSVRSVELPDGKQARRAAFEDVTPPILIASPLPGDSVSSPIRVAGTASVFEATLVVELVQAGKVLEKKTVTASTGAPYRGTFSTTFETTATGDASVVAFAPSAADGSEQHRVEVPIRIR